MEKHVRLGLLLDIYGELLTERQRSILFQSVNEDCSLAEIAEREGVSRQAVRDAIMKATDNLEGYEAKLKLMERRMALMNGLEGAAKYLPRSRRKGKDQDIDGDMRRWHLRAFHQNFKTYSKSFPAAASFPKRK